MYDKNPFFNVIAILFLKQLAIATIGENKRLMKVVSEDVW